MSLTSGVRKRNACGGIQCGGTPNPIGQRIAFCWWIQFRGRKNGKEKMDEDDSHVFAVSVYLDEFHAQSELVRVFSTLELAVAFVEPFIEPTRDETDRAYFVPRRRNCVLDALLYQDLPENELGDDGWRGQEEEESDSEEEEPEWLDADDDAETVGSVASSQVDRQQRFLEMQDELDVSFALNSRARIAIHEILWGG